MTLSLVTVGKSKAATEFGYVQGSTTSKPETRSSTAVSISSSEYRPDLNNPKFCYSRRAKLILADSKPVGFELNVGA